MIGANNTTLVFFGLFLIGMLFVPPGIPFMVPEAEASNHQTTEAECLGAISNNIIAYYTAATCENPFNVTVNIGQRLRITNENGSYHDMLPIATYGGLGTYQFSGNVGGVPTTGTITIQNPPDVGVNYVDTTATISGSQVILAGQIVNNNNFPVRTYGYYHVTDDAGNYVTSWLITGNDDATFSLPAGSTTTFNTAVCCLPNNDGTQVTPYILQAIRDHVSPYSLPSGTPLIDVNIYPDSTGTATSTVTGICHTDISWTPTNPVVYQNVTFTGRIVQEIDGVCDSNSPIPWLEVAPNFSYSTHSEQAMGQAGLPVTNSDGVWTGSEIFGNDGNIGSDYESYVGTWTYNIFFGGDGTYSARSLHDQTGSFAYVTVAGPPTGTVTISSPIEIYAFDGSFNPSPTGGDCTQVGFWDAENKQCILTADIATSGNTAGIKIGQSIWPAGYQGEGTTQSIIITGGGHTITGNGGGDMSDAGVYLYKTTFPTIYNLVIKDFKVGINSHQTSGTKIIGNTIQDATGYGIYVYDTGTCPNCGSGILINGNTVEDSGNNNGGSSIQVQGFQGDGTCNTTIPYFLNLSEVGQPPGNNPTPVTIVANTVTDAPGFGITLDAAGACVNDNTITGAHSGINVSGPGYSTSQSDNNIISNNVVSSSVNDGIVLTGSGNTIDSNTVTDSQYRSGFDFDWRSQNNIITNNVANNNNEYGFYFPIESTGHTLSANTASGNDIADFGGDGFPQPPTVTVTSDITISSLSPSGTTVTYTNATATDNISVASGPICSPASGSNFSVGTTTVTCTATDGEGNSGSATFTVTVTFTDVTAPTLTVPSSISNSTTNQSGTALTFDATATDDVAVTTGPTCDPASGSTFSIGTTTVTCTASDAEGNTTTETFTVTLTYTPLDTAAPTIAVPNDITLTTSNATGAAATFAVTASDNVAVTTGPTCGVASGSNFAIGDTIVTCTASDAEGNTATETFTVTVQLASPPTISIPHDTISFNVNTGVFSSLVYYPQPTATSSLGIASGPTCTPSSNSAFSVGTTVVTCTTTDADGTVGTSTFNVVVSQQSALSDSECQAAAGSGHDSDSVFVCEFPFNVTVEENQRLVWVDRQPWQGFYRHSITSSAGLFDHSDAGVMDMLPSAWGGVGTYSFYDKLNPSLTGSITIAESDTTNPTVTVPSDMTVSTDTPTGTPPVTYSVSASDDREVTSGPTCTPASGSNFSVGTTTVTCSASDAAGNTGTSSFTVTVEYTFVDETPPGLVPPSGITLATTNPSGTIVSYTGVTATDNVAVTSGPTCDPASGTMFPIGITTVTCTATDAAGNTGTTSFIVTITQTILDTSAPAITVSNNISQGTTSSSGKIVTYQAPTAVDNVGVTSGPTCTPASGTLFPVGITTVSCSATDAAGNTATASFMVTIVNTAATGDTTPPTLSQPGNIVRETTLANGATVNYTLPTATDNESVTFGPSCTPSSGSLFSIGSTTVTCIAKDAAGNQGSVSFNVVVTQPAAAAENTLTLQVGQTSYVSGDPINITGVAVGDVSDVTLTVLAPNGNIVSVNQIAPDSISASQSSGTQVKVQNAPGSSTPGCEETNSCFLPSTVTIDAGDTIVWENTDNAAHTATSGSPTDGPDGVWDSSLIMVNQSYSNTFYSGGTYDYFCMVHPWMTGKIIVQGSQNISGINGSFSTEISSGGTLWSQDGTYTINASYGSATETKSFNFTVVPLDSVPFTSVPTDLTISIDKSTYTGFEIISIDTKLIGGSSNQPVNIQINDPVGDPLFLQTLNTNSQGEVSTQFSLPEGVVSGTYTVSVTSIGDLWNLSDSTAFMGEPLEPEVLESSISATNEEGGSVTTYNAGELGYFNTKLTTKSTSPILVTVTVLDAQQNTLGVGFFKTVLPKGDAEVVLGFEIPEGTISGDAQVFTNFFTDWPDQGGVSIGDEISATVNVIGVEPAEEVVEVLEEVVEVLEEPVQMQVTVQNVPGSSFEGCEPDCFLPSTVTIDLGGTVTWENPDDVPHTVTSGTSSDGPSGHFDSSLIMVSDNYSHTFDEAGTYDYYCMVHPWMTGQVVVGESDAVVEPITEQEIVVEPVEEESEPESSGMQTTVQNAPGSSFQGCEPDCFLPSTVTIDLGGTVIWENPDNAAHSTASFIGSISGVVGLEWNSGLMLKDQSFSHTFDTEGTYDYFCMVHPWMQGQVIVQGEEEEEEPPPVQEEIIEVVDILALNGTSNIIFLTGTNYVEANKSSLNDEHKKLTVSSWVKPDFTSTATPQYSAVSKEGSFELFLTNTKEPEHIPGFSVFDGQSWNTILIDSKVTESWHHLVGVVNGEDISLYLDSVLIGTKSIPSQTGYMAASENAIAVGTLINSVSTPTKMLNSFQGSISEVNIITDALTSEQISNLYLADKDMFQRDFVEVESVINGTVTTTLVTTESPELSADECIDLAKERGLYDQVGGSEAYTLVCQFPFDVIIPLNSRLLWMETLSLENAPYHSIQSVDNLFSTGSMTSADMGFYDDTFTYGIYEYYDNFAESLTGKITISKLTNSININEGSASPECADTNLCYDTFAAQVDVGEEVTWRNQDTFHHTVTSGTPGDGPDGLFDSGLIDTYLYFYHTFEEAGVYDYYCTIHPWKQGKVVVGEV